MTDALKEEQLNIPLAPSCHVKYYECLPSTNETAKEFAANGAEEGTVIVANHQTAGRGRLGRNFFSPDSGLYFSIVLRPSLNIEESLLITTAAAVAVCRAIETVTKQTALIKWVNDIFVNNKKVCGILCESSLKAGTNQLEYAILGIGINVTTPKDGFPAEISKIAGTLTEETENNIKNELFTEIITEFFSIYTTLTKKEFLPEYNRRMLLIGKTVSVCTAQGEKEVKVLGIDSNFGLKVQFADGSVSTLSSGEVTIGSNTMSQ